MISLTGNSFAESSRFSNLTQEALGELIMTIMTTLMMIFIRGPPFLVTLSNKIISLEARILQMVCQHQKMSRRSVCRHVEKCLTCSMRVIILRITSMIMPWQLVLLTYHNSSIRRVRKIVLYESVVFKRPLTP